MLMDTSGQKWRRILLIAGGATTVAAVIWYILRRETEARKRSEPFVAAVAKELELFFQVTDPKGCTIGIREEADVQGAKTGKSLHAGEVFRVAEVRQSSGEQRYLRLADGRGWVFTHSSRDGRVLIEPFSGDVGVGVMQKGQEAPKKGFSCMELLDAVKNDLGAKSLGELHDALSASNHMSVLCRQHGAIEVVADSWSRSPRDPEVAALAATILQRYAGVHAEKLRSKDVPALCGLVLGSVGVTTDLAVVARLWARIGCPTSQELLGLLEHPASDASALRPLVRVLATSGARRSSDAWPPGPGPLGQVTALLSGEAAPEAMLLLCAVTPPIRAPRCPRGGTAGGGGDSGDSDTDGGDAADEPQPTTAVDDSSTNEPSASSAQGRGRGRGRGARGKARGEGSAAAGSVVEPGVVEVAEAATEEERRRRWEVLLEARGEEAADRLEASLALGGDAAMANDSNEDTADVRARSVTEILEHIKVDVATAEAWPLLFSAVDGGAVVGEGDPRAVDAEVCISAGFEGGNLRRVRRDPSGGLEILLNGDTNNSKSCFWFFFELSACEDVVLRLRIVNLSKSGSTFLDGQHVAALRPGDEAWTRGGSGYAYFPNRYAIEGCGRLYTLSFSLALKVGTTRIAYFYPYLLGDVFADLRVLRPGGDWLDAYDLGPTPGGRRLPMLVITDFADVVAAVERQRPRVVVSARVHPGEAPASHMMRGVLELLLSSSEEARALRRRFVFVVFPLLNPDGVALGNGRSNSAGLDLNRYWENPPAGSEVAVVRRELAKLQASPPGIFAHLDLHAHSGKHGVFTLSNPGCTALPDWLAESGDVLFDRAQCTFSATKGKRGSARCVSWREFGVLHAHTIEASYGKIPSKQRHLTAADLRQLGGTLVRACAAMAEQAPPPPPPTTVAVAAQALVPAARRGAPKRAAAAIARL